MATIDPDFDGYTFSTANYVVTDLRSETPLEGRARKAVYADASAAADVTFGGRRFIMSGAIAGDGTSTAREYLRDLLANLRVSDRVTKGQLNPYGDGHWWAQLYGRPVTRWEPADDKIDVTLEFFAEDPFRRKNTITSVNLTPSGGDTDVDITYGASQDFLGDAPRIPLTINLGASWTAGDVVRLYNSTAGWRFEKTVVNTLSASQDLVIDGEDFKVYEGTEEVSEGVVACCYPYIVGGQTNVIDFAGTTTYQQATFEFWDRYWE